MSDHSKTLGDSMPSGGNTSQSSSIEEQFFDVLVDAGFQPPANTIADGALHRFPAKGEKRGAKAAWYVLHADHPATGVFGDWRNGHEPQKWCAVESSKMTDKARRECTRRIADAKKQYDAEQAEKHAKGAAHARSRWQTAGEADPRHAYLVKKQVSAHGLRQDEDALLVPVRDVAGEIHGLQRIMPDGKKLFTSGTRKSSHFHTIGELSGAETILICEGFATGATLHEATGAPVVVAFDCGNLSPVTKAIHQAHPQARIIVAADNDRKTPGNPGLTKARAAAESVGGQVVSPDFVDGEDGSDFNDYAGLRCLDAVRKRIGEAEPWPAIIDLEEPELPRLTTNLLPKWAGDFAAALSASLETPPELAIGLVLAACATAAARRLRVHVRGSHFEPANLWIAVALGPGNRKSAAITAATAPLGAWELREAERLAPQIRQTKRERKNAEARVESLRKRIAQSKSEGESAKMKTELADLEETMPEVPVAPRLWTSDATPEKLGMLLAQHEERLGWLSSEGGSIFEVAAGRYTGGAANLDLLLKTHDGDPDRLDRVNRESVCLADPLVTIGLTPQPGLLQGLADNPGFRHRGFLARFLYLLPPSPMGYRTHDGPAIPESVQRAYAAGVTAMLDWDPFDGQNDFRTSHTVCLGDGALREYREFTLAMEAELRPGGRWREFEDWGGKCPGTAARIAGVLHGILHAHGEPWKYQIEKDTMAAACGLMAVIGEHSRAALGMMGANPETARAIRVLDWIRQNRHERFTVRDAHQALKGTFQRVADLRGRLEFLAERGYVRIVESEPGHTGRRPSATVIVNPSVVDIWK